MTTMIRCAACDRAILSVSAAIAAAFSAGRWMCGDPSCFQQRQAAADEAAGRLGLS